MDKKRWTEAELIEGYKTMATLNRELAQEFSDLEHEATVWIEAQWPEEKEQ